MTAPAKAWDVVVVGSANTGFLVRGAALPKPGETARGGQFYEGAGGKGANQAVARLGARVGRDARGDALLRALSNEGVDTRHVARDGQAETGVALIQLDEKGRKQIFFAPSANDALSPDDVRAAEGMIRAAHVVAVQLEVPLPCVEAAVRLAHGAGVKVVLDPAPPRELPDGLLRRVAVIKPNAKEAEALTGVAVTGHDTAREAAKKPIERGVSAVAIQAGDAGNLRGRPERRRGGGGQSDRRRPRRRQRRRPPAAAPRRDRPVASASCSRRGSRTLTYWSAYLLRQNPTGC